MAQRQESNTEGEPPTPTTATSLFPHSPTEAQSRLSSASSLGPLYDQYLASPSPTTTSFPRHLRDDSIGDIAITTARRRNSSPIPFLDTAIAADPLQQQDGQAARLHRRRSRSSSGGGSEPDSSISTAAARQVEHPSLGSSDEQARRARQGWGGHASPVSPTRGSDGVDEGWGADRRRSLSAETIIRPLPATPPPRSIREETRAGVTLDRPPLDPSQINLPSAGARPRLSEQSIFDPHYSVSSHRPTPTPAFTLSRVDSVPFSLASGTTNRDTSYSSDSDEDGQFTRRPAAFNEDQEELEARSPLQPSTSPQVTRRSTFLSSPTPSPRLSPSAAAHGASTSPTRDRRASSNAYPKGAALTRRSTLGVAARGIRRMSLRVVNLAGVAPEVLTEEADGAQPASRRHPHQKIGGEGDGEDGVVEDGEEDDESNDEALRAEYERAYRTLRGKTLGIFGPENKIRIACAKLLTWYGTEPLILVLILLSVVVFTIQSSPSVYTHPRPMTGYFHSWEDYTLFGIFIAFTVEIAARIIVTGLYYNPPLPASPTGSGNSTPKDRRPSSAGVLGTRFSPTPPSQQQSSLPSSISLESISQQIRSKLPGGSPIKTDSYPTYPPSFPSSRTPNFSSTTNLIPPSSGALRVGLGLGLAPATVAANAIAGGSAPSALLPTPTSTFNKSSTPFVLSIRKQRQTYQQAFLRHSWNRIDLVAVLSFWISFVLAMCGVEGSEGGGGGNWWIFRGLSTIRSMRLLAVTTGTSTILQSLKRASPQLVNVALFVAFAMAMFSIIGVQAFQGSYRRNCMWIDPTGALDNVTFPQHCGGYTLANGTEMGYILSGTGQSTEEAAKGFLCPAPSICIETQNPDNGAMSFDNVFAALFQVVIIASANTWTGVMYSMMDADFFVSCLFFIVGLIILNYWLINMFVAVITSTFGDIMDETKHSAFSSTTVHPSIEALNDASFAPPRGLSRSTSLVRRAYEATHLVWVALALVSIALQASKQYDMPQQKIDTLDTVELYFTIAFDVEIVIRAFAALPDWRSMLRESRNIADLGLCITTTLIQIPAIHNSAAYPWFTIFQIARFYRVVIAIPRMKRLLVQIMGTITGLLNMILFLLAMTFFASLIAVQLFRGVPDAESSDTTSMTFFQIYNSFLSVYQILSSENWTDVVNNVLESETGQVQIVIAAGFFAGWLLFGYFILINLFVAVINESFAVAEELKRKHQLEAFNTTRTEPQAIAISWFRGKINPYNYSKATPKEGKVNVIPLSLVTPSKKAVVSDYLTHPSSEPKTEESPTTFSFLTKARKALRLRTGHESLAMDDLASPTESQEHVYQGNIFPASPSAARELEQAEREANERRAQLADFIAAHPTYDRSLWFIKQDNPIRRLCQKFVDPAYGDERLMGRPAVKGYKLAFQVTVLLAIIGSIVIAAIATPLYRLNFYLDHGAVVFTWYTVVESALGLIFVLEFAIKVIADGFVFSPNAYLLSIWNTLDFFILLTLIVNVVTALVDGTGINRFTRALKAFRALRLINLFPGMQTTFYNVLIVGAEQILDASVLAILYIIPFAVWGQNIFAGLLYFCNDSSVSNMAECAGEFVSEAVSDWSFVQPRVWANPATWSFDSFKDSLLILFEIISLEGWIDVMESVMQITGRNEQPEEYASQWNALFFVGYNLLGAVFILTLFISVIIANFTRRSGMSLLTTEQRQWIDLRRLITRQRPAKRPKRRPTSTLRAWCFDRAVQKHGWWSRSMTGLYCLHVVILMTQATTNPTWADIVRNFIFLFFTLLYFLDILVRSVGLGWTSYSQNGWNLYDLFVVAGTFATTIPILLGTQNQAAVQLQKLFLVSIAFKLVQKNNQLNQLFKTAAASLPAIMNIFALWLVLFLAYAIFYMEVFGLTRWGSAAMSNSNYSSFFKALVLLALQSTGEGWNEYMHNYTVEFPDCTESANYLLSDCGSAGWAFFLFISWNVLSMYLMANLILGAVIENFSYVFQSYGRVININREQMRSFKKTWAEFDHQRTGYLQRKDIVKFFGRLGGIFEVKIFRDEWSIASLQRAAKSDIPLYSTLSVDTDAKDPFDDQQQEYKARREESVDLFKLARALNAIDPAEVRERRRLYNHLYHEAIIEAEENPRGISFSSMLVLLAHYKLIDDEKALRIDELIERRDRMKRVAARVNSDGVRNRLKTFVLRRRFLTRHQEARQSSIGVPEINVVDESEDEEAEQERRRPRTRPSLSLDTSFASGASSPPADSILGSPTRRGSTLSLHPDDHSAPSSPTPGAGRNSLESLGGESRRRRSAEGRDEMQ